MPVRIITDSGSDYYDGDSDLLTVLPLTIAFGDTVYRADVDLTREGFYEKLVEGDEFPTTGQVNPYQFQEAVAAAVAAGEDAVAVVISEKLSGTYRSAVAGTEAALEEAGAAAVGRRVRVVDSGNVTVGEHVLVEHALHMADAGASADEIADELERLRDRVCTIGLLDTLEYLKRGGRIPPAAATVGQLLSIKPVIAIADGEVQILGRARGSKNGRNLAVEKGGGIDFSLPVQLGYSGLSDALLQKYIRDSHALWAGYPGDTLPALQVGATIGTHVGPDAVAVAFFKKNRREVPADLPRNGSEAPLSR